MDFDTFLSGNNIYKANKLPKLWNVQQQQQQNSMRQTNHKKALQQQQEQQQYLQIALCFSWQLTQSIFMPNKLINSSDAVT